jgi:FeS assembly SUF system protein
MDKTKPTVTESQVIAELRTCYDPEIPVNIYDLGLIYEVKISPANEVYIKMTLTAPNCPVAGSLPASVESKVKAVPGVSGVKVELAWEPPWNRSMMADAAKLSLGMDLESYGDSSARLYGIFERKHA